MSTVILVGLVYIICEVYLDGVIVYGQEFDELLLNLRKVFTRFRERKLTLNPDKCVINARVIEYTGHLLDSDGLHFTEKKLDAVRAITLPQTLKALKSFAGLVNYFRDHVRNLSILMEPLQRLLDGYTPQTRSRTITWTEENVQLFETIKTAVAGCQKLYFLNDTDEIYLYCDASDYGIGAYLCQLVEGIEIPIGFMSRSLSTREQRWTVGEKEMFAIVYSLLKFEYLIKDRIFTIFSDHENLEIDRMTGSPKVLRWKLEIQEYAATIVYSHGEDTYNPSATPSGIFVADGLSRRCAITDMDEHEWVNCIGRFEPSDDMEVEPFETETAVPDDIEENFAPISTPIVIPRDIYRMIAEVHCSMLGHHGVAKTTEKLQRIGHKVEVQYVREFIRKCPCCQKMSALKKPIHANRFTLSASEPMRHIGVDAIGPLVESSSGDTYILAIMCLHTRLVELYPVKSTSASDACDSLVDWSARYGNPYSILSDNGTQFVNSLITELTEVLGAEHVRTKPYSSEENGIIERSHKETLRHLRAFMFDIKVHTLWPRYLPLVRRIMWTTVHSSTGVAPADIIYGGAIDLNEGFLYHKEIQNETGSTPVVYLNKAIAELLSVQRKLLATATKNLLSHHEKHMAQQPTGIQTEFPINSFVFKAYPDDQPITKLHTTWLGPYRVQARVPRGYVLVNLVTSGAPPLTVSEHRLKAFHYEAGEVDPAVVAQTDSQEFEVENIVSHAGDPNKKGSLDFLVKWAGYDDSQNTYVPWKELRNNPVLHEYLKTHGLKKLVPQEHR